MKDGMLSFLSEESVNRHKEYMRIQKNRYSVMEKGTPKIKDKSLYEIFRMNLDRREKESFISLKGEILAHDLYFNSFAESYRASGAVRQGHKSESSFLYRLYEEAKEADGGFLIIYKDNGQINTYAGRDYCKIFIKREPVLAVDICEHAYFCDYGFEKNEYLARALSVLDLSKLN